ncbi:MAG: sulfatase family protein [Spirochaetota bacterium]
MSGSYRHRASVPRDNLLMLQYTRTIGSSSRLTPWRASLSVGEQSMTQHSDERQPNIIWLMADDMGYGDPACYGTGRIATPEMDRLAREGVRFTDAHAASSVCTPSRYSVMTGRYNWRSTLKRSVIGGFSPPLIDPARPTVASFLKDQGYSTGCIGKWHLGIDWQTRPRTDPTESSGWGDPGNIDYSRPFRGGPIDVGFDRFFGIAGSLNLPPWVFLDQDRTIATPTVVRERSDDFWEGMPTGLMAPDWIDEQVDVHHLNQARAFINEQVEKDSPFFLYLTPSAPHSPWSPPEFLKGKSGVGPRGDLILTIDWMVGELLDQLDRLGIGDNTLFVVTSDNGGHDRADYERTSFGHRVNADLRGFKSQIWDGGHRVPFLARWPQTIPAGTTCSDLIGLHDLFATCAEICNKPLPARAAEDSRSFLPSLRNPDATHTGRTELVHHSARGRFSIREKQWKLIDACDSGGFIEKSWRSPVPGEPAGQLYRLDTDTSETRNLWDTEPEIRERLLQRLRNIQDASGSRQE